MKKKIKYDFLIIGAGFIGSIMALMLASRGLKVALIEKNKNLSISDDRTTALSQGTTRILDEINCWRELISFCQPIDQIYVSNRLSNNYLKFDSKRLSLNNSTNSFLFFSNKFSFTILSSSIFQILLYYVRL